MGHLAAAAAAGNSVPAGRRRAVTVGINYIGTRNQLSGCINDSDTFVRLLTEEFGYKVVDIRQLRDDHPQRMPTRKNMTAALNWLVNGARPGDHLFFHYSGHGSQQRDTSGDEMDGKDETLVPCDFQSHGMLSDDDLRRLLVLPLPKGVRLTVIMDCCHSGTAMDLPYKMKLGNDARSATLKRKSANRMPRTGEADVVMISGCMDTQTSADIGAGSAGNTQSAGAMTTAFKNVISAHATIDYFDIVHEMRRFLQAQGFKQVPQLSSEQFLNLSECFMPEVEPQTQAPPAPMRPPVRKALTIGINYLTLWPGRGRLSGCINDSETMVGLLKDTYGFTENQIAMLRDDRPDKMPTKANILSQIRWLTEGAQNGDEMFLHYSGHGGQAQDQSILPCDFENAGQLTDNDLHRLLVDTLPQGCRMWVIMDCSNGGAALDLEYKISIAEDGSCDCKRNSVSDPQRTTLARQKGEVIMISGFKDMQTADAGNKGCGAMTSAFRNCVTPSISCQDLLLGMRQYLKGNGFDQVPQMSSDLFVQMDASFVNYQAKKRGKRELAPSLASRGTSSNPPSPMRQSPYGQANAALQDSSMDPQMTVGRLSMLEQEIAQLRLKASSPMPSPMHARGGGGNLAGGMLPPGPNLSPSRQYA
jgi:hypothetical protein